MSIVSVRYMIDDVPAAITFYTTLLGFALEQDASPAFAAVSRNGVRLLLSGEGSSGKRPLADGRRQEPGGWNRIHLLVTDLEAEAERLRGWIGDARIRPRFPSPLSRELARAGVGA
jgi:catechol 2,3-dioxygenase-like lactoylglutathione lyase family enzyme